MCYFSMGDNEKGIRVITFNFVMTLIYFGNRISFYIKFNITLVKVWRILLFYSIISSRNKMSLIIDDTEIMKSKKENTKNE